MSSERTPKRWLLLVFVVAFGLRLSGIAGNGYPMSFYPDEINNVERSVAFWNPSTGLDLNPHWFNKPALGYYRHFFEFGVYYLVGRYVAHAYDSPADFAARFLNRDRGAFYLIARASNAFWGALTCVLLLGIGRRWASFRVGLLAALVLAIMPGHVFWGQVAKHDVLATFCAVVAFSFILAVGQGRGRRRDYIGAGVWIGLGWAVKYSPIALVAALLVAHFMSRGKRSESAPKGAMLLGAAFLAMVLAGFVGSPYNFLDPTYFETILKPQLQHLGRMIGFAVGEVDPATSPLWMLLARALRELASWSVATLPLVLLAIVGAVLAFRDPKRRSGGVLVMTSVLVLLFLLTAANFLYTRANHLVIILPFLALFAAVALDRAWESRRRYLGWGWAVVLLLPLPGFPVWSHVTHLGNVYREHSYRRAWEWLQANVPADSTVVNDGEILPLIPDTERFDWMLERIRAEIERSNRRMRVLEEGSGGWNHHRRRIAEFEHDRARYVAEKQAARRYPRRRYDVIVMLKPWQSEKGPSLDPGAYTGYDGLWDILPPVFPAGPKVPPVERLRIARAALPKRTPAFLKEPDRAWERRQFHREQRAHPVRDGHPAEWLVTSEVSYDNYVSRHKRTRFPHWTAFYDDLKSHYDCVEIPGGHRRIHWTGWPIPFRGGPDTPDFERDAWRWTGAWNVRIYDLRRRVEDRPPIVRRLD